MSSSIMTTFKMSVTTMDIDTKSEEILYMYNSEFTRFFQDCNITSNIKISHIESNIYLVEYPESDIKTMYKYLCDDKEISLNEMCEKLNFLFANPVEIDWWEVFGLRGNIILD